MNENFELRISELEEKIANLERFKADVERFMREAKLHNILYYAGDALELTELFQGTPAGYYCPKCFSEHGEFHALNGIQARFQSYVGQSMENAACSKCGSRTAIYSRGNRVFP